MVLLFFITRCGRALSSTGKLRRTRIVKHLRSAHTWRHLRAQPHKHLFITGTYMSPVCLCLPERGQSPEHLSLSCWVFIIPVDVPSVK